MYEHQKLVNQIASEMISLISLFLDQVPDEQQILEITARSMTAAQKISSGIKAEEKTQFKIKFIAKVGLRISDKGLDLALPDAEGSL